MTRLEEPNIINSVYPITGMTVYKSGLQIHRKCLLQERQFARGNRKPIEELSRRSLSRLAFVVTNTSVKFHSLMTLTYPNEYPLSGKASKKHLHHFLTGFTRLFGRTSYLWFLEFQRRGAPHYHILTTYLEPNRWQREQFAYLWARIVSRETIDEDKVFRVHRHPSAWERIKKKDGAMRYALKYATKLKQKAVPNEFRDVGRFWGCSRDVIPKPIVANVTMSEDELREHLYRRSHQAYKFDVIPKFIWYVHKE